MANVSVLTESDIRALVGLGHDELTAIEAVYPLISEAVGSMPPIQRLDVPEHNGEIDIKSAYLPGFDGIAVKISAGFFDNPRRGLPSLGGLMLVFETETGLPAAALFDNGYLTNIRTALAGAVAAKHLARADAHVVGIVGAGMQARLQVEAVQLVRDIDQILIWARRPEAATELATSLTRELGIEASVVASPGDTVTTGGIVVTTTPSTEPLITKAMLRPGLHLTAIGSDAEHKQELAVQAVIAADVFVSDSRRQSKRLGELRAVHDAGLDRTTVELGEVIAETSNGRNTDDQITICDLTGTGAQDTAIASLVMNRARAQNAGQTIAT